LPCHRLLKSTPPFWSSPPEFGGHSIAGFPLTGRKD
jgi:hypothetical protein